MSIETQSYMHGEEGRVLPTLCRSTTVTEDCKAELGTSWHATGASRRDTVGAKLGGECAQLCEHAVSGRQQRYELAAPKVGLRD